jgi:HEAT repeat protein
MVRTSEASVDELIAQIQSANADVRYKAWRSAGPMGAPAVVPLGTLMASPDTGVAKAAKGALETVAHHAARPGAREEAYAVSQELLKLAGNVLPAPSADVPQGAQVRNVAVRPFAVRAEALHLLGFTADSRSVPGIAKLLSDPVVRDEARMALERIPGSASLNALKQAEKTADDSFRSHLRQSLHNRALRPETAGMQPAR